MQISRQLGSLRCEAPNMQSVTRSRPISAAIRLNQSNSHAEHAKHRFKRPEPELRGPRNGLRIDNPKLPR
eukprot:8666152-Alexandrium_andersonii.AAC.1